MKSNNNYQVVGLSKKIMWNFQDDMVWKRGIPELLSWGELSTRRSKAVRANEGNGVSVIYCLRWSSTFSWEGNRAYPHQTRMLSAPICMNRMEIRMQNSWISDATLTVPFLGNWRAKKITMMEMASPQSRAAAKTSFYHISIAGGRNGDTKTYNYTWSTMRNGAYIWQIRDELRGGTNNSIPSNNILEDESNTTFIAFSTISDCEVYKTITYAHGTKLIALAGGTEPVPLKMTGLTELATIWYHSLK